MCQWRLKSERHNERLRLLLLAGVLLLYSTSPSGPSVFPGCQARLMPLDESFRVHGGARDSFHSKGGTRLDGGGGNSLRRRMVEEGTLSSHSSPKGAPVSAPAPSHALSSHHSPKGAPVSAPAPGNGKDAGGGQQQIAPAEDSGSKKNSLLWLFIVGPAVFVMVLVLVVAAKIRLVMRKRRRDVGNSWKRGLSFQENQQLQKYTFAGVPTITFEELEAACEEFTNVIAASTDCRVFKGTRVSDGVQIAVTRMLIPPQKWTARREIGFRHKVEDLARLNHENMVNLVAYCATDMPFERMLVFEYASNGTLYEHLHSRGMADDHLDWATRMRIVMGAACGLEYLHHKLVPPTSHFKFDAKHVFLTEDYAAKLADFAVSPETVEVMDTRSLGRRKSFAKIATAVGYSDWEAQRHTPNLESNIRGFGVFLLEVVTGRRPFTDTQGPLIDWAKEYLHDADKMWYLVDPSLKDYKKGELVAICAVVRMCIRPRGNKLPTMNELADKLSKALRMTREAANRKSSPLLWAEMELLASMEHSQDDGSFASTSPKHRSLNSQDSGNKLNSPFSPRGAKIHNESCDNDHQLREMAPLASLPRLPAKVLRQSNSANRRWAANPGELEPLSPQDSGSGEDQEIPLAAAINTSASADHSFGRSFRRVWAENSTEMSTLDLVSPRGGRTARSNDLDR